MAAVELEDDGIIDIKIGGTINTFDIYEWAKKIRALAAKDTANFLENLQAELSKIYPGITLRAADKFWQQIYKLRDELGKKNIWTPELAASPSTNGESAASTDSPLADYQPPNDSLPSPPTAS